MKLFVISPTTKSKHYLNHQSKNRADLVNDLGSDKFEINSERYSINDVKAESSDNTAGAMAAGGVIGVAGGVPGVVIGGILGALFGKASDNEDKEKAEAFNLSAI